MKRQTIPAADGTLMDEILQMMDRTVKPECRENFLQKALDNTGAHMYNELTEQSASSAYTGEHADRQQG